MPSIFTADHLRFLLSRFRERLWIKPLFVCLLSVGAVFLAKFAEGTELKNHIPQVTASSIETLLSIMASSMLVIATFSLSSMVSAYASASSTTTPRSFTLVVSDDASQNALSTFVGSFIFSIVALIAFKNEYFDDAGLFILFLITIFVFAFVILTFVRWVDRIARLGRVGSTIEKVEQASANALKKRKMYPRLQGVPLETTHYQETIFAEIVGYVQHIDVCAIQSWAEERDVKVIIAALPGTYVSPGRPLAHISSKPENQDDIDHSQLRQAFEVGKTRLFDNDPRFGLVVLAEIAGRALSPAVNDPGTAIGIIGTLIRLFVLWKETEVDNQQEDAAYDRVEVPEISMKDMFDDAFMAIGRDGAGTVEVSVRLQKALHSLSLTGDSKMQEAALYHSELALKRSKASLTIEEDLRAVESAAKFTTR